MHPPSSLVAIDLLASRSVVDAFLSRIIANKHTRALLNLSYLALGEDLRKQFYHRYGKSFREQKLRFADGKWVIRFGSRWIWLPIRGSEAWLDWDLATSLQGNQTSLKKTYGMLLANWPTPAYFLDVGANYGLHSLVFLAHGIEVISIEPNPQCHTYFQLACSLNRVIPTLEACALGSQVGVTTLAYPEKDTWNGTTNATRKAELTSAYELSEVLVPQTTIDELVHSRGAPPHVIKIDAEASELDILDGGKSTLLKHRPLILFESAPGSDRKLIAQHFCELGYQICGLPLLSGHRFVGLGDAFLTLRKANFAAVPGEKM